MIRQISFSQYRSLAFAIGPTDHRLTKNPEIWMMPAAPRDGVRMSIFAPARARERSADSNKHNSKTLAPQ